MILPDIHIYSSSRIIATGSRAALDNWRQLKIIGRILEILMFDICNDDDVDDSVGDGDDDDDGDGDDDDPIADDAIRTSHSGSSIVTVVCHEHFWEVPGGHHGYAGDDGDDYTDDDDDDDNPNLLEVIHDDDGQLCRGNQLKKVGTTGFYQVQPNLPGLTKIWEKRVLVCSNGQ